jgi:hypothetical protein
MTRIVDPLIADLQREHAEATRNGRVWKSRWIQFAASIAFFKVIVICAWIEMTAAGRWTLDDRKSLTRAAVISAVIALAITALLVSRSSEDYPKILLHPSPKRFLYLVPFPFVVGIVLGGTLGIVFGLGGRALSRRLIGTAIGVALICSAIVLIDVGWVAPAAHIAYRMTLGDTNPAPDLGEQSLVGLSRLIEPFSRDPAYAHFGLPVALRFDYHRRVALSLSPLMFTLFALTMAGCFRRRWVLGIGACATFVVYGWLVINVRPWDFNWPVFAAAWLPNATVATLTAAFGILRTRRRGAHRSQA